VNLTLIFHAARAIRPVAVALAICLTSYQQTGSNAVAVAQSNYEPPLGGYLFWEIATASVTGPYHVVALAAFSFECHDSTNFATIAPSTNLFIRLVDCLNGPGDWPIWGNRSQ
jgi:hypothetical protein